METNNRKPQLKYHAYVLERRYQLKLWLIVDIGGMVSAEMESINQITYQNK
jgi:hypothetical protein